MLPRPVTVTPRWLPELDNPGLVLLLCFLGLGGTIVELTSTTFVPRLALYVVVLALGALGIVRRVSSRRSSGPKVSP